MTTGFISIGSNIDKEYNIASSLKALTRQLGDLILSNLYETEAVGFKGDNFYNLVVQFNSCLDVKDVARLLRNIELEHGRTRDSRKYAARTLDLDLIIYGDLVISDGRLQIPRDEIERYAFVLEPLAQIAPNLLHPVRHESYAKLWADFDKTGLKQQLVSSDFLSDIV